MRSSKETYENVAKRCSSYARVHGENSFSNAVESGCTSCLTCDHFADDEHCVLDLYDPIVENL